MYCDIALRSLALEGRHNTAQGVSPVCMSLTFFLPLHAPKARGGGGRGRGTLDRAHALSSVMSPLQGLDVMSPLQGLDVMLPLQGFNVALPGRVFKTDVKNLHIFCLWFHVV